MQIDNSTSGRGQTLPVQENLISFVDPFNALFNQY